MNVLVLIFMKHNKIESTCSSVKIKNKTLLDRYISGFGIEFSGEFFTARNISDFYTNLNCNTTHSIVHEYIKTSREVDL